ncbi:MAG: flippase-like domain-containing protein [Rhodospirillales bacterium]|nr:flippase-like domain-containing protein [Rhodospirillales bacterium]
MHGLPRPILILIKVSIAAGLIWWLVGSGRLDLSAPELDLVSPYLILGFAAYLGSIFPTIVRWRRLLRMYRLEFGLWRITRWIWIAEFFALVLPGGTGAELSRGYYVYRSTPDLKAAALSTVFIDRVFGLWALLLLGTIAFGILYGNAPDTTGPLAWAGAATALLFAGTSAFFLLLGIEPAQKALLRLATERIREVVEPVTAVYGRERKTMIASLLLSLASQLCLMISFLCAGWIVGTEVTWIAVFAAVPLIYISNYLPIAPGGIGVGEAAASFLFAAAGVANGAAIMLVVRLWIVAVQLSGGLVYLLHREPSTERMASVAAR